MAIAALAELQDIRAILGFRRGSTTDVVPEALHEAVPNPNDASPAPAELAAYPDQVGQLNPDERSDAVALFAVLQIDAAGPARPEVTDDQR